MPTDDLDRRVAEFCTNPECDGVRCEECALVRDLNADRHYWRERVVDAQKAMSEATLALAKAERERDEAIADRNEALMQLAQARQDIERAYDKVERYKRERDDWMVRALQRLGPRARRSRRLAIYQRRLRLQAERELDALTENYDAATANETLLRVRAERAEAWLAKVPEWTLVPDEPGPSDECLLCGRLAVDGHAPDCYWTKEGLREEGFGG